METRAIGFVKKIDTAKKVITVTFSNGKDLATKKTNYIYADVHLKTAIDNGKCDEFKVDDQVKIVGGFVVSPYTSKDGGARASMRIFADSCRKADAARKEEDSGSEQAFDLF